MLTTQLNFSPAGDGGNATRMTAELDVDAVEIGNAFETNRGVALALVPDSYFDRQFAEFMDDLVDDIEAGRSLPPLGTSRVGIRERASADVHQRRADAERSQRAAARPMTDARPMVDPDAAAAAHRRGQPDPDGNWGN